MVDILPALFSICPANDNGTIEAYPLCAACDAEEVACDGLCGTCISDANAMIDDRRGGDEWMTLDD